MPSTNLTFFQYLAEAWTKPGAQRSAMDSAAVYVTAFFAALALFLAAVGLAWLRAKLRRSVLGQ